jgi:hypothetical protein
MGKFRGEDSHASKQAMVRGATLSARKLFFVGEAFSLDSAVAAGAAMAKSAHRGWKAAPTEKT